LQAANTAVNQAYSSILVAEKAGANVTNLVDQLDSANNLLAQAESAYSSGDKNAALNNENAALRITQQVMASAQISNQTAQTDAAKGSWTTAASTTISAIAFFSGLYLALRHVKRDSIIEIV